MIMVMEMIHNYFIVHSAIFGVTRAVVAIFMHMGTKGAWGLKTPAIEFGFAFLRPRVTTKDK